MVGSSRSSSVTLDGTWQLTSGYIHDGVYEASLMQVPTDSCCDFLNAMATSSKRHL